jgi:hypothetical protein
MRPSGSWTRTRDRYSLTHLRQRVRMVQEQEDVTQRTCVVRMRLTPPWPETPWKPWPCIIAVLCIWQRGTTLGNLCHQACLLDYPTPALPGQRWNA